MYRTTTFLGIHLLYTAKNPGLPILIAVCADAKVDLLFGLQEQKQGQV
jgi:hypothetical protein